MMSYMHTSCVINMYYIHKSGVTNMNDVIICYETDVSIMRIIIIKKNKKQKWKKTLFPMYKYLFFPHLIYIEDFFAKLTYIIELTL